LGGERKGGRSRREEKRGKEVRRERGEGKGRKRRERSRERREQREIGEGERRRGYKDLTFFVLSVLDSSFWSC
jgi:hypothetical protein